MPSPGVLYEVVEEVGGKGVIVEECDDARSGVCWLAAYFFGGAPACKTGVDHGHCQIADRLNTTIGWTSLVVGSPPRLQVKLLG